jgi:hypothetical protein
MADHDVRDTVRPPLWPLEEAGGWEGGCTDSAGQRWVHVPWVGWQRARPSPFFRHDEVERQPPLDAPAAGAV